MTVRTILTHPDKRLRVLSQAVEHFDQTLEAMVSDLEATMRAGPGGVGIAAPQVGEGSRLIVIDCRASLRPCKNHGLLYMVNPNIKSASGETLGREGCLSVPDWVGIVPRAREIGLTFDDIHGVQRQITASGFEARVIQHEIDHLEGILFIDRVVSSKGLVRRLNA